jgi:ADP-heptose:LPS heptosyltransferase
MLNFRRDVIQYPKEYSKVANVLINHNYAVSDMCSLTSTQDQIEKHVIELVVEYIAKLGVSFELPEAGWLYRYSSVLRKTDFGRSSDVVVYLGSGQQHKRMPTSFWLEVVYTLANQYGFKVSVLPGYSEEEQQEALYFFDILNNANIKYSYPKASNLMDIAQILLSNQIVVSSDTYIIHLSGALNIPVVGIYTSTSEVMYGPYFKPSDTVCSEFYSSCEWKNKIGNCNAWEQHCEKTLCKSYIRVDDVVEKIIHLINNR